MMYSTKQFTFDKGRNEMVAEASDLRMQAYPETFNLCSHVTNKVITVRRAGEDRTQDEDNELQATFYRPVDAKHTFKIIILND